MSSSDPIMTVMFWALTVITLGLLVGLAALIGYGLFEMCRWLFGGPYTGRIIRKEYSPSHSHVGIMLVGRVPVPHTYYYPEQWCLVVLNCRGNEKHVSVGHDVWIRMKVGDYWK